MKTRNKPTFLTVDDEPAINWILGRLITRCGYSVDHALSGSEAIELSRHTGYQAVFIDAKLPDILGPALVPHLRKHLGSPIVVLISGYCFVDDPTVEESLRTGLIQHFVAKPFLHRDILALIDQIAQRCGD